MGDLVDDLRSRFKTTLREAKRLLRTLQQRSRTYNQLGDEVARLVDLVYGVDNTEVLKVEQVALAMNDVEVSTFLHIKELPTL